jgi:hypothetical protein
MTDPQNLATQQVQEQPRGRGRPRKEGIVFVKQEALPVMKHKTQEDGMITERQLQLIKKAEKERIHGKKPLSEAQQAHLKNLYEMNLKRRQEKANQPIKPIEIPKEAPEGYVPVVIKEKKRTCNRDVNAMQENIMKMMFAMQEQMKSLAEQRKEAKETAQASLPAPVIVQLHKNVKEKKQKEKKEPKKRERRPRYQSETSETDASETEQSETETSDSDSEYLKKYEKKAVKRLQTVQEIEKRLKEATKPTPPVQQTAPPKGKYDHLRVF